MQKCSSCGLKPKVIKIFEIIKRNPFQTPPYKKLMENLSGAFSRRITIQHQIVYEVLEDEKVIKIIGM